MDLSDGTYVTRARSGDSDAFRTLVDRHSRSVFRLAFRMTGNEQDAEDVVQESMLRAYKQLGKFDERASFGTWLYRIAANCSLDLVRSRKRRVAEPDAGAGGRCGTGESRADRARTGSQPRAHGALAARSASGLRQPWTTSAPPNASAFVLRHFEGMGIEDVSRVLECQPGAAKHSVFRAVQKLRRALEPVVSAAR